MANTLRVDDPRVKADFDQVQATLAMRRGRRPSQTEVLWELLAAFHAAENQQDPWLPFTEGELRALRRHRARGGAHAPASALDRLLYGGDAT